MRLNTPKKNQTLIPPEYANVRTLKGIAFLVGFICLSITSYATWTIYTLSNRIGMREIPLEVVSIPKRVTPINFVMLDTVRTIDKDKKSFMLDPIDWNMFYGYTITSTLLTPPAISTSTAPSTSTPLLPTINSSTDPLL